MTLRLSEKSKVARSHTLRITYAPVILMQTQPVSFLTSSHWVVISRLSVDSESMIRSTWSTLSRVPYAPDPHYCRSLPKESSVLQRQDKDMFCQEIFSNELSGDIINIYSVLSTNIR